MSYTKATGTPCWVDLSTPDVDVARTFYETVFGWSFTDTGAEMGHYQMAHVDGAVVCGIGPLPPNAEWPSVWTPYLAVEDLGDTLTRSEAAGFATVNGPMEIPGQGHMAIVADRHGDPHGAVCGFWQSAGHEGFGTFGVHGAPCWFEVNSRSAEALGGDFASLFGLEQQKMEGMEYWTLHAAGRPRFGALQMTAEWDGLPPHWMTYFAVDDADAAVERVKAAGGAVQHGPFDMPFGRTAVVSDPGGATFMVITPAS